MFAKSVYVDVASREFGKRGRPTNVSRTAMLTGLARREVRRQRDSLITATPGLTGYVTKASLVLSAWHLDPEFVSTSGKPRLLPLEGATRTFAALLRRCGASDVRVATLLKQLKSAGAVRERADGRLEALRRSYIPHALDEQLVRLWGTVVADVAATYAHNLTRNPSTPFRFERSAVNDSIGVESLEEFIRSCTGKVRRSSSASMCGLTAHQVSQRDSSRVKVMRMGAGVYQIED